MLLFCRSGTKITPKSDQMNDEKKKHAENKRPQQTKQLASSFSLSLDLVWFSWIYCMPHSLLLLLLLFLMNFNRVAQHRCCSTYACTLPCSEFPIHLHPVE